MTLDIQALDAMARQRLSPHRYRHSVAVSRQALRLAVLHSADPEKAEAAGLVHDICKDMDTGALLNYLEGCGILLDIWTREHPAVWHALAGAEYLRREAGILDEDLLAAVRYHTSARANMSLLEKVVYVADLSSDDRDFPDVDVVRDKARRDLDEAVVYALSHIVGEMVGQGKPILRDTWEAYNQLILAEKESCE